jgi:hypothetical protein
VESARLLRAQADLERATKQNIFIGLSLHQTLLLLILHNRSTTAMELKSEFKVARVASLFHPACPLSACTVCSRFRSVACVRCRTSTCGGSR